ncbi:VOC family protein [Spirochaeta isovalerica]|uniref:Catechol 2,3-dioxygenase-like lactoylglutathione lyase family enzyme n=1 Tax=Spirochaeta isovalerica TaxID=150 RepID=A0A841R9V9_9SPIO|nr:VOC family protein [Spirochaeta isovalerica]MBB6480685.1 catechol 2,3-dioxygenase-like lactoylglutathione lyase family enzyme [Spirochaeta isovalerica]
MFEIQHIGIPVEDMEKTVAWYGDMGFSPHFRTVLNDGVKVAFIEVAGTMLEFYTSPLSKPDNPVIGALHFISPELEGTYSGPSGENLVFEKGALASLAYIELNSSDPVQTADDLVLHSFVKDDDFFRNGNVRLKIREVSEGLVAPGPVNHIAFDEKDLQERYAAVTSKGIPVVEGIAVLPFFENGVTYFVTENHDGLRLEYNQFL